MEDIKLEKGKKVDQKKADPKKGGQGQVPGGYIEVPEVEGQHYPHHHHHHPSGGVYRYVRCPHCGAINYVWDNFGILDWWWCWYCRRPFC